VKVVEAPSPILINTAVPEVERGGTVMETMMSPDHLPATKPGVEEGGSWVDWGGRRWHTLTVDLVGVAARVVRAPPVVVGVDIQGVELVKVGITVLGVVVAVAVHI